MSDIGVIIGRFQIHELHPAHQELIESVLENHEKVILFLGTTPALGTKKDPLDFITRKLMIEEAYNTRISAILPLENRKSDEVWSNDVDRKIREVFPSGSVTLYGSRDSFIPYYTGRFETKELESRVYVSASNIREKLKNVTIKSKDFRAGVIYSVYNQYPMVHPTVDVVICRNNEILLGRKFHEQKYRFIGGFVDPTDESLELAVKREAREETGLELDNFQFICSRRTSDWRYRNVSDRAIITTFFKADYIFGSPEPNDDIEELCWVEVSDSVSSILVEEHSILFKEFLKIKNNG